MVAGAVGAPLHAGEGDAEDVAQAFRDAISEVQARVKALLALPLENLGGQQLAEALRAQFAAAG